MAAIPPSPGYTRNSAVLPLRDNEITVVREDGPLLGRLELVTEDGRLCLALSGDAAADLLIDLKQFLARERP